MFGVGVEELERQAPDLLVRHRHPRVAVDRTVRKALTEVGEDPMGRPWVRLRRVVSRIGHEEGKALVGGGEADELDELGAVLELARVEPGERVMIRDVLRLVTEQRDGERRIRLARLG